MRPDHRAHRLYVEASLREGADVVLSPEQSHYLDRVMRAKMGDVVIAEPGALIGFAGPRVIESTVRVTLPEGFQRAEFLQTKGAIDFICDRRELRKTIAETLAMLQRQPADAVI